MKKKLAYSGSQYYFYERLSQNVTCCTSALECKCVFRKAKGLEFHYRKCVLFVRGWNPLYHVNGKVKNESES